MSQRRRAFLKDGKPERPWEEEDEWCYRCKKVITFTTPWILGQYGAVYCVPCMRELVGCPRCGHEREKGQKHPARCPECGAKVTFQPFEIGES